MIRAMGCGFFKNIWVIGASTRPLSTEKYLAQNIENGTGNYGARKTDPHIFVSPR
jgi:hypothetical protein